MRKYKTTWAVFFMLLVLVFFVFSLTKVSKKTQSFNYIQLAKIMHESPADISEIQMVNNEPIVMVKLKNDIQRKQVVVPMEEKAALIE